MRVRYWLSKLKSLNRRALVFGLSYSAFTLLVTLSLQLELQTLPHGRWWAWLVSFPIYYLLMTDRAMGIALKFWAKVFWR